MVNVASKCGFTDENYKGGGGGAPWGRGLRLFGSRWGEGGLAVRGCGEAAACRHEHQQAGMISLPHTSRTPTVQASRRCTTSTAPTASRCWRSRQTSLAPRSPAAAPRSSRLRRATTMRISRCLARWAGGDVLGAWGWHVGLVGEQGVATTRVCNELQCRLPLVAQGGAGACLLGH